MIKFFGKNNDLRTEEGVITKTGYVVMLLSSVFGLHPLCRLHLPTNSYDAFNVLVIVD